MSADPAVTTTRGRDGPILAFGEVLWDTLPNAKVLGGAPLNFAYRVSCLGQRALVASCLGTDHAGREALARMRDLGLPSRLVQRTSRHRTGAVLVSLDAEANPEFEIVPDAAYDFIRRTKLLQEHAASSGCIYFGTVAQRSEVSRSTLRALLDESGNTLKLFDVNLRKNCFTPEIVDASLAHTDVLKLNEREAECVAGMFGLRCGRVPATCDDLFHRWTLSCCVVTLAERGAFALSRDGRAAYAPGFRVPVVDTVGAGDAFSAGFIVSYLSGAPLAECCAHGNAMGALAASQRGATGVIERSRVEQLLARPHELTVDERFMDHVATGRTSCDFVDRNDPSPVRRRRRWKRGDARERPRG